MHTPSIKPNTKTNPVNLQRRHTLGALGALSVMGATGLISCGGGSSGKGSNAASSTSSHNVAAASRATVASSASATTSSPSGICTLIPTETIGPFPLSTLLDNSLVLRENVAEDKTGVPLNLKIKWKHREIHRYFANGISCSNDKSRL